MSGTIGLVGLALCITRCMHVCRQPRTDTQATSNQLVGPPTLLALSPSTSPSPCFSAPTQPSLPGQHVAYTFQSAAQVPSPAPAEESPASPSDPASTVPAATPAESVVVGEDPVDLSTLKGSMVRIRVRVPVPEPPHFVSGPKWNAAESTSATTVVAGSLDSPGIVFYAVRYQHAPLLCPACTAVHVLCSCCGS